MKKSCPSAFIQSTELGWILLLAASLVSMTLPPVSQTPLLAQETDAAAEELQQIKNAERFLSVLEKNPRYGTALDRVYGHHVEFGSLDKFLRSLHDRAAKNPDDGAAWMLLGMFEAQRGGDALSVEALTKADKLRPQDALASFYLGQAQLRIGQSQEAIASFERAISRKPPRADLLEIFQTLGRVHQRAQRTDEALQVWQRLEALFPNDPRVLEQVAITLAEEGQSALALERYQKLAQLERDDYRKVIYQMAAAGLIIKTGRKDEGIKLLESVLTDLNPTSWLYRDVRRRIEDVFLRASDQDSLVKYYQRWLETHPVDLESMTRLARFLATSARVPEASQWMEKALKLAPSRTDLRKAFIDQLVNDQRIPEAIKQYEQLNLAAPGNPDFLRDWGKLVLRNREVAEADRKQQAVSIWNQIIATRPKDALTVSQVADLYRQNKMNDEAEQLYRKAVELAPGDPQYREYLGEFLHIQKRSDEALAVWKGIAETERRNAVNITRLAEIYNSFGFPENAVLEIKEAVKLDPKDFSLQIRASEYHAKANQYDQAMNYVEAADVLAANDDERAAVIQQRIEVLQVSQRLEATVQALVKQLRTKPDANSAQWYLAARYLEAERKWPEATEAIDKAIELDSKSIPAMTVAARIAETSGDFGRSAQMNRTLADLDRRSRGDHLMNVSRLEAQLGRTAEALQAAQELIASAPGKTENYEFYAQTCFRLGKTDEGLDALRKAVRINPNDAHLIMALGNALSEQLRTEEAIELYWRAFDKSEEVDDKVLLTMKITPMFQQINQFDKLIDRFERDRKEEEKRRVATICLAQAWQTAGDIASARQELESLLSQDTRDTNLLNQLAKLCQAGADLDAAVGYQRQLVAIAPGHETEFPLAGMLMSHGQIDEAREIFVKLTQREEDPVRQVKSLDSLITQSNFESAIGVLEPLLAQNRDDWELLYREGVAWASLEKSDEAINRFQRILALNLPFDSLGRSAAELLKQSQAKAKSENLRGITTPVPQKQSPLAMRSMASQVQRATGMTNDNVFFASGQTPPVWMPESFGVARMAAYGWLLRFEDDASESTKIGKDIAAGSKTGTTDNAPKAPAGSAEKSTTKSIVTTVREKAEQSNATQESIYDWLYVAQLKNDFKAVFDVARRLAKSGGKEELQFFLTSLNMRGAEIDQSGRGQPNSPSSNKSPLSEDDLQLVRDSFKRLSDGNSNIDVSAMYGSNVVYSSSGQAFVVVGSSAVALTGVFRGDGGSLSTLLEELRLAGKKDEASALLNEHIAKAATAAELASAMALVAKEERHSELPELLGRWQQAALKQIAETPVTAPARGAMTSPRSALASVPLQVVLSTVQPWMGKLAAEEENAQVLSVLGQCLTVAEAEAKHRSLVIAAQPSRRNQNLSNPMMGRVSVYNGKNQTYASINFPPASAMQWIDATTCALLYQAHDSLKRNDVVSDLADFLRKRLDEESKDSSDKDRLLCGNLYLACALWWAEEQDEAAQSMATAAALTREDIPMQQSLAEMYQSRGDFEDALNVIDAIPARDQKVLQQRELMALTLAERLGDTDRARSAAERLFGLRLDSQTQLGLVDRMKRLGLSSLADAILARAERTATNQTSSLASLMLLYQGQGKTEQAIQLAHMLLRKTQSPISITQRSGRNPARYRTQDSTLRTQALQILHQTGSLKTLIGQLENQLERSPGSILPLQQLIEFYGVTGQKSESLKKIQQALQVHPDSPIVRLQLAKELELSGKASEACDQYLELLRIQPGWVTDELSQVDRLFVRTNRKAELVKALSQLNMKRVSQPFYLVNTATTLIQNPSTAEAGLALMERVLDAFPQYRSSMMLRTQNSSMWKIDRFYQFAKRAILPSELEIRSNPWTGLDQINSYNGNGEVSAYFQSMVTGVRSTDKLADLEASIKERLDKNPQWHGGRAMLALIELASNRKTEAQQRLKSLADDKVIGKTMPAEACWIIGQELNRTQETRDLATVLFERALVSPTRNSMSELQYSPVTKLVESYVRDGQKEKARELLLKLLSTGPQQQFDQDYATYQRIQDASWAASKLVSMGLPIDAVKLYRGLLDQPEKLAGATRFGGNGSTDYFENNIRRGLSSALAAVTSKNADEVVAQLLSVPEKLAPDASAIDLMLAMPDISKLTKSDITSSYVELLNTLSADPKVADRVAARLAEMAAQRPEDLSIAIAIAAWKIARKHEDAPEAVKMLVALAGNRKLEQIAAGRRPNSRQRREAAMLIPLWIVARHCIGTTNLHEEGTKLAELCRVAAARQIGIKDRAAILFDWGNQLMTTGRKDEAEARWSELLEIAIERPARKENAPLKSSYLRPGRKNFFYSSLAQVSSSAMLSSWIGASAASAVGIDRLILTSVVQDSPKTPPVSGANRKNIPSGGTAPPGFNRTLVPPRGLDRLPPNAKRPQPTDSSRISPLTISQFRIAMAVARKAAQNSMPALSRKAVRESLSGGFPIAEPDATVNAMPGMPGVSIIGGIAMRSSQLSERQAIDPVESEVVSSLKEIVALWKGEAYTSQDRYVLLKALVLPDNKPQEIRLYVTTSNLSTAKVESLAETLVSVAAEAGQLDDLRASIAKRTASPAMKVAGGVLEILIGLKQNSIETVSQKLGEVSALAQSGSSIDRQTAFLAAIRAFDKPELKKFAFPILRDVMQKEQPRQTTLGSESEISSRLAMMVNKYMAETGDSKSVQEYFDNVMLQRQTVYSRYSGDYGLTVQWNDLANIAQQSAELKLPLVAMEFLGRAVDYEGIQSARFGFSQSSSRESRATLAAVVGQLQNMAPLERYQAWYKWTMPTASRQTMRCLFMPSLATMLPKAFAPADRHFETQIHGQLLSNLSELVDSAKHASKLAELHKQAQSLVESKMPYADILLALVAIAQDDVTAGVPMIQALQKSFDERIKPTNSIGERIQPPSNDEPRRPSPMGDYLVFHAALQSDKFVSLYEDQLPLIRNQLLKSNQIQLAQVVNFEWANRVTSKSKPDVFAPGSRLEHWMAVNTAESAGSSRPWWNVCDDQLVHVSGPTSNVLYLRYPLTGNFTLSVEGTTGNVGFGGILADGNIQSVSGHESIFRPGPLKRSSIAADRYTIEVRDNVTYYSLNNQVFYREEVCRTTPWLFLRSVGSQLGAFGNIQVRGEPVVPDSIRLIYNDCMDGWNCSMFNETQPRLRVMQAKPTSENDSITYYQREEPKTFSWSANGGELIGTAVDTALSDEQSWIYYQRPLINGESFNYEFFYVPGSKVAHPSIGQVALILDGEKLQSHWIATLWDRTAHTLSTVNSIVEEGIQRGPAKLPLKENDWNAVQLELRENKAIVTLNGTVVCERPMEPQLGTRFGLYKTKVQSSHIRNLTLKGNWPKSLPTGRDLLALEQPDTPDQVLSVAAICDDAMIAPLAAQVVQKARSMPADEAFGYLSNWVLPSESHGSIRLYYSQTSLSDSAQPEKGDEKQSDFGGILSPAVELVQVATRLNKLTNLTDQLNQIRVTSPSEKRSLDAIKTLIALETGADESIKKALKENLASAEKAYPKGTPQRERNPEFLVAWRAGQHPKYWSAGNEIAHKLRDLERNKDTASQDSRFRRQVHVLVGDIDRFARTLKSNESSSTSAPTKAQWTMVPLVRPEHRLAGYRPSTWSMAKGVAEHIPAETWGQLYFQSPLRGKFEISARRTAHENERLHVAWGMHSEGYDLNAIKTPRPTTPINIANSAEVEKKDLEKDAIRLGEETEMRIVVDGRKVSTWRNGAVVHEEVFDKDPDPWLLLQSHEAENFARVSNLRILGKPEIPSEIDLLKTGGLASWRADFYNDRIRTEADAGSSSLSFWQLTDDQLLGQLDKNTSIEHRESLVMYQRPLLEDGEIEFKTWYEPGTVEVHPALGRSAFLLTPEGLRLHRLTDAQYEVRGLAPDNQQPIHGAAPKLSLKVEDWNHVRLTLQGDRLTISVNGTDAGAITIEEPADQRYFGLFRYSNKTECRVLKLLYRGQWPKTLPSIDDQQLAATMPSP